MNPADDYFLLEPVAVHQDFFWFAVLLGWSLVLVVWRWHPQRQAVWAWAPWTAGAAMLGAVAQFAIFSPPFGWLFLRSNPAPPPQGYTYIPPLIPVERLSDLITGVLLALMGGGWLWLAAKRQNQPLLRWLAWPAAIVLALLHYRHPVVAMSLLGAALLRVVPLFWRAPEADRLSRAALVLAALIPLLSPVGPFAAVGDYVLREGPPTVSGLISAFFQALAGACALAGMLRGAQRMSLRGMLTAAWREDAGLISVAGLWFAAGLGFAIHAGAQLRVNVLEGNLRAVVQRAASVRIAPLLPFAGDSVRLEQVEPPVPGRFGRAHLPLLTGEAGHNLGRELGRLGRPPPFSRRQGFVLLIDGWLVAVPGDGPVSGGDVTLLRRASPRDIDDWSHARPVLETSPAHEIDADIFTRAPLTDDKGRMLAWLEFVRLEMVNTLERRARAIPLLVNAMGLVVASALFLQRRAARDRQAALRDAAIAAEANRLKTAFLAKVSHELRTPIQSLLGYGELLRREVASGARAEGWLNALRQHGELMTRLVNDLIDLSAIEAGTFRLAPRPLAPAALVRETVESLRPRAETKGLALRCETAPELPPRARIDGERLRQIVLNLAGNAVKFTDYGGVTVSLSCGRGEAGQAAFTLAVRDTGPGIPPREQARLFNAFSRLEFTAHKEGSGLGLSLAAALCRAMGGDLTVASDGHSGSCFTATFAAETLAGPGTADAPASDSAGSLAGRKVLVVDDNTLVRELFVVSLTDAGAICRTAGSVAETLAAVAAEHPDAIVLDLALPDGDGIQLAPRLRSVLPGVRLVGVSAHAGPAERSQALAAGMDVFLTKPVALGELAVAVAGGEAKTGIVTAERPGLRARLEGQFRAEAGPKRSELDAAVSSGDWRRARAVAHYLANSAAAVHDPALLSACAALARAAEAGERAGVQSVWLECDALLAHWSGPHHPLHASTAG